uniref:Uncharacterized protein n=1 Tax=Anopheles quadriannulatus TaxID=34691 RepID=A0A182XRM7_ANOQN
SLSLSLAHLTIANAKQNHSADSRADARLNSSNSRGGRSDSRNDTTHTWCGFVCEYVQRVREIVLLLLASLLNSNHTE